MENYKSVSFLVIPAGPVVEMKGDEMTRYVDINFKGLKDKVHLKLLLSSNNIILARVKFKRNVHLNVL